MNGERRPIGEHLTYPREQRVANAMVRELYRLQFICLNESETAAIQFAMRTHDLYRHAHRIGRMYRRVSDKRKYKNAGYGLEYRFEMIGSMLVFRRFLSTIGVQRG